MYVLVENNEVVKKGLPKVWQLNDGRWVSNFHLMPEETLLAEGWLPLVENPPAPQEGYDIVEAGYTIHEEYVEQLYELKELLPPAVKQGELEERQMKKAIKKYINEKISSSELNPLDYQDFIEQWKAGISYSAGDIVKYKGLLYEVIQAHTSQKDWTPDKTPSLFSAYFTKDEIPAWVQPTGSHDCYNAGDMVSYNSKIYKSLVDGNVWNPEEYEGRLWELQE